MEQTKLQIFMGGYATHKNYDILKFLKLCDEVRSSKEYRNLKKRVAGS